ncbi:hypothetical protein Celal_0273 [Cellulophaga algicola DSM 14237]|uniref:Uncharacterized protein n=1 Tax=Cellulophaga algicola (strain DSM 14237 / IC166 / ACAM 630) TaxID=688270 RepID=E6X8N2_CELAD|nr:hypothetical protein Celal_0273 [Cellulophaga algicola DSM 14237]
MGAVALLVLKTVPTSAVDKNKTPKRMRTNQLFKMDL